MLRGHDPEQVEVDAVNVYLVLLADHGMNASTFTSRVVTSTDGDMYSAVTAAIGSLKGPKHGGANEAAMACSARSAGPRASRRGSSTRSKNMAAASWASATASTGADPRAEILKEHAHALCAQKEKCGLLDVADQLAELAAKDPHFIERQLFPNVDYYSAIVLTPSALRAI